MSATSSRSTSVPLPQPSAALSPAVKPHFHRIILKLSGESLTRSGERGINMEEVFAISEQIKLAWELGCQIGLVVGGGTSCAAPSSLLRQVPKLKQLQRTTWGC